MGFWTLSINLVSMFILVRNKNLFYSPRTGTNELITRQDTTVEGCGSLDTWHKLGKYV